MSIYFLYKSFCILCRSYHYFISLKIENKKSIQTTSKCFENIYIYRYLKIAKIRNFNSSAQVSPQGLLKQS